MKYVFLTIQTVILSLTVLVWMYIDRKVAIVGVVWLLWNFFQYVKGLDKGRDMGVLQVLCSWWFFIPAAYLAVAFML